MSGQFTCDDPNMIIDAAVAGLCVCSLPDAHLRPFFDRGELVPVLECWRPSFPGYHLYYLSPLQAAPAFTHLVNKPRWRG